MSDDQGEAGKADAIEDQMRPFDQDEEEWKQKERESKEGDQLEEEAQKAKATKVPKASWVRDTKVP